MSESPWELVEGADPVVATAIHDGHALRAEVAAAMALPEADRLREEDPHTGDWARLAPTHLIPRRSRFEVDLNRPREKAVYARPEDAWGLALWRQPPSQALLARSLALYDAFYGEVERVLEARIERFGAVVLLDLHSYNHRREGPAVAPAKPAENPEVNVGTGSLDRGRWGTLVEGFMSDLRQFDFQGRGLDVRENVRFRGGNLSRWIHQRFPGRACAIAVEFKKFFMDEWSGQLDADAHRAIAAALEATLPGLREQLRGLVGESR